VLVSLDDLVAEILSGDAGLINFCIYEARSRKILVPLFHKLAKVPAPSLKTKTAFLSAWETQGLWIRDEFAVDAVLFDVLAHLLPGYSGPPLELFRGERWSNHAAETYGPSWTAKRSTAEMFARGLNCCPHTGGVLLHTTAPASAILATTSDRWEAEYVVDRRGLGHVDVLERYTRETKSS
jgi:hypothetical protein